MSPISRDYCIKVNSNVAASVRQHRSAEVFFIDKADVTGIDRSRPAVAEQKITVFRHSYRSEMIDVPLLSEYFLDPGIGNINGKDIPAVTDPRVLYFCIGNNDQRGAVRNINRRGISIYPCSVFYGNNITVAEKRDYSYKEAETEFFNDQFQSLTRRTLINKT